MTASGTIVGTFLYMSPEQAQGKKVDTRSDVFAFGSLLYEMLAGRPAFQGESPLAILSAIVAATRRRCARSGRMSRWNWNGCSSAAGARTRRGGCTRWRTCGCCWRNSGDEPAAAFRGRRPAAAAPPVRNSRAADGRRARGRRGGVAVLAAGLRAGPVRLPADSLRDRSRGGERACVVARRADAGL